MWSLYIHPISGCSVLAEGAYKVCHDKVTVNLHLYLYLCGTSYQDLSSGRSIPHPFVIDPWRSLCFVDQIITARRPDSVIVNKHLCTVYCYIPLDFHVVEKEMENIILYTKDLLMGDFGKEN